MAVRAAGQAAFSHLEEDAVTAGEKAGLVIGKSLVTRPMADATGLVVPTDDNGIVLSSLLP